MTLEDLRVFVTAYRAASFSEAARRLGCTQGAVTQHVKRLENELGSELFHRQRRGVTPSAPGTALYEAASGAMTTLESAVDAIKVAGVERQNTLRLAVGGNLVQSLRRATRALKERRPRLVIELVTENTTKGRLSALREGRADLTLIPLSSSVQSLEVRPHMEVELGLLVHARHPLARRRRLRLEDLASIRYIAQSDSSATCLHVRKALRDVGLTLEPHELAEDPHAIHMLVEVGAGETFIPLNRAAKIAGNETLKLVPIPSLPPIRIGWCARSFALLPEAAQEFMEICAELAAAR